MPLYDFKCPACGLEFEVSRPLSRSGDPALCPIDQEQAERVFTMPMTFTRGGASPPSETPAPGAGGSGFSHFGHSHGMGAGGHSHGATTPPAEPGS